MIIVMALMLLTVVPIRYWFSQVFIGGEFDLRAAALSEQFAQLTAETPVGRRLQNALAKVQLHSKDDLVLVVDNRDGTVIASSKPVLLGLQFRAAIAVLPAKDYRTYTRTVESAQPDGGDSRELTVQVHVDRSTVNDAAMLSGIIATLVLVAIFLLLTTAVAAVIWKGVQVPARNIVRSIKMYENGGEIGEIETKAPVELREISAALTRTVALRHEKDAVLREVLRNAADGILVIDEDGIIENFNAAAERLFGYSAAEAIGRNITLIMPEPEATQHSNAMKRYRASKQSGDVVMTAEVRGKRKDGSIVPVRLSVSEVRTGGRRRFAGIICDMTATHIGRDKLLRSQNMLEALREAQTDFIATYDIKKLSESLNEVLLDSTGSEYGFLGEILHNPAGEPYLLSHAVTNIAWDAETQKLYEDNQATGMVFCNLKSLFGAVMTSGEPVIANDPANDPRRSGLPKGHLPLNAFLGLPIRVGGKLVGMAGIANRQGGYNLEQIELLNPFMLTAGNLILAYRSEMARRESEAALAAALHTAEAANHAKSRFLATMSHEIRTPMNGVLGMLDALQQTALDDKQRDYAQTAAESGQLLMSLMNEILDLSKVEAGQMEFELMPFNVRDLATETVRLFETNAMAKGIELSVSVSPSTPLRVTGDRGRIRQILSNLIGNAIKFTQGGSVSLDVSAAQSVSRNVELQFEVTDTGIGIAPEQQGLIFARFTQADSSITRKYGGTGLGLAICRELAELMHGTIECTSELGRGSRFTVKLTLERVAEDGGPLATLCPHLNSITERAPGAAVDGKKKPLRVLVADDVAVNQKLLRVFLEPLGHHVDVVSNGLEAVAAVARFEYDLVLMDIQMPQMDGYTATRQIREMTGSAGQTYIVALTANAMSGDRERCIEAGANDYVSKPIKMTELYAAIDRAPASNATPFQAASAAVGA